MYFYWLYNQSDNQKKFEIGYIDLKCEYFSICLNIGLWFKVINTIQLLHDSEGDMNINYPKEIIFPKGNVRGKYIYL